MHQKDHRVFIAGFGGQGVVSAGQILAQAGMDDGLHVTVFTSYGPEQRGGASLTITILSQEEVGSPIASTANVLAALNQPSLDHFEPKVDAGGLILYNSSLASSNKTRSERVHYLGVACSQLAADLGDIRAANVVALGALAAACPGLVQVDSLRNAIRLAFADRSAAVQSINQQAFDKGFDTARNLLESSKLSSGEVHS